MLELCKEILLKVSFDKLLFQKELNKALRWISNSDEQESLKTWCYSKFGKKYPEVIKLAFIAKK
tara:strand:+ start:319 stop:510 length:192 start_codon:yes stop_codon:yes gene_type:complete